MPINIEEFRRLIDGILNQKIALFHSRVDSAVNTIIEQLEKAKDPSEYSTYDIPKDIELKLIKKEPVKEEKIDSIHKYIRNISAAANQLNLINSFLEGVNHFCSRAALFLLREDKLVGWKGSGFSVQSGGIGDEEIKKVFFSLSANTIFKYVLEKRKNYSGSPASQPDDHLIYSRFGGGRPDKIFITPFFVKGKPQAIVYTDSFDGKVIGEKEIEILSIVAEMSLDLLPLRQKLLAKVETRKFEEEDEEKPDFDAYPTSVDSLSEEKTVHSIKANDPERLARVIINDIILYNKTVVEDGRTHRNLYNVLQDTIAQAKELYLNKFSDLAAFEKQLIETLAKGDKDALKGYRFETI